MYSKYPNYHFNVLHLKYTPFMGSWLKAEAGTHCPLLAPRKPRRCSYWNNVTEDANEAFPWRMVFPPFDGLMGFNAEKALRGFVPNLHMHSRCLFYASEPAILGVSNAEGAWLRAFCFGNFQSLSNLFTTGVPTMMHHVGIQTWGPASKLVAFSSQSTLVAALGPAMYDNMTHQNQGTWTMGSWQPRWPTGIQRPEVGRSDSSKLQSRDLTTTYYFCLRSTCGTETCWPETAAPPLPLPRKPRLDVHLLKVGQHRSPQHMAFPDGQRLKNRAAVAMKGW